jgi:hypothetical protein
MKLTRVTRDSVTSTEPPAVPLTHRLQARFRPFYRLRYDLREEPYGAHRNLIRVSAHSTSDIRRRKDLANSIGPSRPRAKPNSMPTTASDPIHR